jgi:hypothetical protein
VAAAGLLFGATYYSPIAADGGRTLGPTLVRHSIRYDFSAVPAAQGVSGWVWPVVYLTAVCLPFLTSRDRHLRPLGVAVAASAAATYVLFELSLASVWCFFAAALSTYLAFVLYQVPGRPPTEGR